MALTAEITPELMLIVVPSGRTAPSVDTVAVGMLAEITDPEMVIVVPSILTPPSVLDEAVGKV